jgi:biotin carboxyl carrier protein
VTDRQLETSLADQLGELLRLVGRSDIEELEVEHEDARFLIRRDLSGAGRPARAEAERRATVRTVATYTITSTLVGIFRHLADHPIEEGQAVTVGHVVGSVDAMRMLNRIQSEHAGTVQEVLVREGQPVEYGQPLFVLRDA